MSRIPVAHPPLPQPTSLVPPIYARLLQTLGWIDAQGQRSGALKAYTRIGDRKSVV